MSGPVSMTPPAAGAAALFAPNPNAPALSAEQMQNLVDQAANFNLFSRPEPGIFNAPITMPVDPTKVIGIRVQESLHRFRLTTLPPSEGKPLTARNIIGERVGTFSHRWLFAPADFVGTVDSDPPPTAFDSSASQRFVMRDSICKFGRGEDGFRGFGAGQTMATISPGGQPQLYATAVGTIVEGLGKFKGNEEGTYVYCGTLSPTAGFVGNIMLRVMDRNDVFRTDAELPEFEDLIENPEPDVVYILFRGQAVPSDKVTPTQTGLIVEQGLRLYDVDLNIHGRRRLESSDATGRFIGKITANINFNPAYPGGGSLNPIPFTNQDSFVFTTDDGCQAGRFTAESSEGRVFLTQVGGQGAIRFGGVGRILSGNAPFEGIRGLMTDNSVVVFAPHVSASVYVLRIDDPKCKFHCDRRRP
jgi:hypothetical protein